MRFTRVLIANRGEIAIRIARACREAEVHTVAVYSEADAHAPHLLHADEAVCIGPPPSQDSYLHIEHILDAARATGADAVHPGYGFLAENAAFARAVEDAGLVFIGPSSQAIATMGDKTVARQTVHAAGVPVVPAEENPPRDAAALAACARRLGYPILIKAAAGGGGKGMRIVRSEPELAPACSAATREALGAFGDDRVFLERYVERPRHIEVQVLADNYGAIVHLGERECSVQRRHQKIIEETPSPGVTEPLRQRMTAAAIAAARCVAYRNAGTVEFLLDADGNYYFLEMNTRLQVEHPVTELVTNIDLVRAQLRIAMGERLWFTQDDIITRGAAIEGRVYAEDPANHYLPSPGTIVSVREPAGPGIRVDSGIAAGFTVPIFYDPMLAKVSALGETRQAARRRLIGALADSVILGCTTNIPLLIDILEHPAFERGDTHTHFLDEHLPAWRGRDTHHAVAAIAAAIDARQRRPIDADVADQAPMNAPWSTLGRWRLGER